jgi:pantoate--beta-alanine ligase
MELVSSISEIQKIRKNHGAERVGFVPTMGALHAGHAELLKTSKKQNDFTVLSIFVNPTQFNNPQDFEKYPITLAQDKLLASDLGVDVIWLPQYAELYPDNYRFKVSENSFSKILCGAHRPGHFDGVLSIVMKLLNIVQPHRAYFGEKDFQQLTLVQDMVKSFFMNVEIVPVPTIREVSGLAMSSRNSRLSSLQLDKAALIYQTILQSDSSQSARDKLTRLGFQVDYVEDIDHRRYVAAFIGDVRLIDNVKI